jgi:hypothetical protein
LLLLVAGVGGVFGGAGFQVVNLSNRSGSEQVFSKIPSNFRVLIQKVSVDVGSRGLSTSLLVFALCFGMLAFGMLGFVLQLLKPSFLFLTFISFQFFILLALPRLSLQIFKFSFKFSGSLLLCLLPIMASGEWPGC